MSTSNGLAGIIGLGIGLVMVILAEPAGEVLTLLRHRRQQREFERRLKRERGHT